MTYSDRDNIQLANAYPHDHLKVEVGKAVVLLLKRTRVIDNHLYAYK